MDDPTVNWSKETHDEIESKMVPFLRSSGYNVKKDVQFLPISVEIAPRDLKGPSRMPIIDKFKDMGTVVMGKVESGTMCEGDSLLVMPNKAQVKVLAIYCDEDKAIRAGPGENLQVKLSGIEEEDVLSGFVLCSVDKKPMKKKVLFVKNGAVVVCRILGNNLICVERFSDFAQLGRFTLRTEGKTVAVGKVMDVPSSASA
ncbi:hypothetical protein SLE2022_057280 [Rubroshorea leprosula]